MQITLTNDGTVGAEYELGVQPKQLLQSGESITIDLSPQSPVIIRVPENLAELEDKARQLGDARALIAEAEARQKAEAKDKAKAAKNAADPQNSAETGTDTSSTEQNPAETDELITDPAVDQQNQSQTASE